MNKEDIIVINNCKIPVIFKTAPRSYHVRILIYKDGRIVVTRPKWVSLKKAKSFLAEKKSWLKEQFVVLGVDPLLKRLKDKEAEEKHYQKYKALAKTRILKKVKEVNNIYNFSYRKISVRNQKTRWGSCSRQGNLSFNYRLAFLEEEALFYVIAHELCHLKEFNHSASFWRLVSKAVPNYKYWRQKLRNGSTLDQS
jgi:predicted metal-dependent hydrolase